jgi:hypothetical protein
LKPSQSLLPIPRLPACTRGRLREISSRGTQAGSSRGSKRQRNRHLRNEFFQ